MKKNDFVYSREKTHASVTVTVVRDRKIRTALRTNQIAEFVTVTAWKKIKNFNLESLRAKVRILMYRTLPITTRCWSILDEL